MGNWVNSKIKELQASDERRKMRWLYGLTGATLILILAGWGIYAKVISDDYPAAVENEPSFFATLKAGVVTIVDNLRLRTANTLLFFKNKFEKKNTIKIEGQKP